MFEVLISDCRLYSALYENRSIVLQAKYTALSRQRQRWLAQV